ncbi:MAG: LLM class flavin-dependent oxidoreductase [Steroidobacteraceae bacterium]
MKFGIRLIEYLGESRELLRLAVKAEEAGADSVWFPHDTFMRNTWVLTSAAASLTRRVQLGGVGINPYTTDPCEIATYAATLDELSNGRCIVGLGMHTRDMIGWTGRDTADYLECVREAVDLIRRLLRGEVAASEGRCFRWTEQCYLRFKPRRAEIPIYVSSFGTEFHELAGEIGDGAQPMITPPSSARLMASAIGRGIARAARDRSRFTISGCAWLSLSAERAAAAARMRKMVAYFGPYLEDEALATAGLSRASFAPIKARIDAGDYEGAEALVTDDMLRLGIVGTPKEVIRQIEDLAAVGIDEVGLGGPLGPDPGAAIELLGREVIPYFRASQG